MYFTFHIFSTIVWPADRPTQPRRLKGFILNERHFARQTEVVSKVILLAFSAAFFFFAILSVPKVQAATDYWFVLPGLNYSGIYEYGWHFDEGGDWGARDFNRTNDGGLTVSVRGQININPGYAVRYAYSPTTCRMDARAQGLLSGQWTNLSGTNVRYLHINPGSSGFTSSMQSPGTSVTASVGTVAGTGGCLWGSAHLHQSGDLSGSSFLYRKLNGANDTCWSDSLGHCSAFSWSRAYVSCSTFQWGSFARTGTIWPIASGPYTCSSWQQQNHGTSSAVFSVGW
jgi:hypothetical protein